MTARLLDLAGVGAERLHVAWVSSAEAQRFADIVTTATEEVRRQGPFDAGGFGLALSAVEMTLNGETLRWLVGKQIQITRQGDVYGRTWKSDAFEERLDGVLAREYHKNLVYQAIQAGFTSVRAIGGATGLELMRISNLLTDMEKTNMVEFTDMQDKKPVFAVL